MNDNEGKKQMGELINLAMDYMEVAVTIIDPKGTLLYYNRHSAEILDRKSEYIGTDIHSHHRKADSNKFKEGRKDPIHYEANPYGNIIFVTLSPIIKNGEFAGCVQTVRLKHTASENANDRMG